MLMKEQDHLSPTKDKNLKGNQRDQTWFVDPWGPLAGRLESNSLSSNISWAMYLQSLGYKNCLDFGLKCLSQNEIAN